MIRQSDGVSLTAIISPESIFFLDGKPSREEVVRRLAEKILPQVSGIVTGKALSDSPALLVQSACCLLIALACRRRAPRAAQ